MKKFVGIFVFLLNFLLPAVVFAVDTWSERIYALVEDGTNCTKDATKVESSDTVWSIKK